MLLLKYKRRWHWCISLVAVAIETRHLCTLESAAPNVSGSVSPTVCCQLCPVGPHYRRWKSPFEPHTMTTGTTKWNTKGFLKHVQTRVRVHPMRGWRNGPPRDHTEWEVLFFIDKTDRLDGFSVIIVHRLLVHFYFWYPFSHSVHPER